MPPKGRFMGLLKWGIPALIIALIVVGFATAGATAGTHMIKWWILANATLAGLGAAIALGHPLTILTAIGAQHLTIKPHCPWQNGKVERFNRTLQTEWAYHQVFTSNTDRARALAPWLEFYNTRRRHSALGGLPPTSRLSPT